MEHDVATGRQRRRGALGEGPAKRLHRQVVADEHAVETDLAAHDIGRVADTLHAPLPAGVTVHYQKHMAHHLLPTIGREWLDTVTNAFLIRDPQDMILSLSKVLSQVRLVDTGMPQQLEIFEQVRRRKGQLRGHSRNMRDLFTLCG